MLYEGISTYPSFDSYQLFGDTLVIDEGITVIPSHAFYRKSYETPKFKSIYIPDTVEIIEDRAFMGLILVDEVIIPNSVKRIGDFAFHRGGIGNASSVIWPDGIQSLTIGDSVEFIGEGAFAGHSLDEIVIPGSVKYIGDGSFRGKGGRWNLNLDVPDDSETSLILNEGLEFIAEDAFSGINLTEVEIPDSVITISEVAFRNNRISRIRIGDSIETIGDQAFRNSLYAGDEGYVIPKIVELPAKMRTNNPAYSYQRWIDDSWNTIFNYRNESPTDIILSTLSFDENISEGSQVLTITSDDPDIGDPQTYSLHSGSGGDDYQSFRVQGSGLHVYSPIDFESKSTYQIQIGTTDLAGETFYKDFTLSVNDINERPTNLIISTSTIEENQEAGVTVAKLSSADPDNAEVFTYSLVEDSELSDNDLFSINADELILNTKADISQQSSYIAHIKTEDSGGLSFDKQFTLTVVEANEAPTGILTSVLFFDENISKDSVVSILNSVDPNSVDSFTYDFVLGVGDDDNDLFILDSNQLRIIDSPDFEEKSSYSVRVRTKDFGGLSLEKAFTFTVNDINEPPEALSLTKTVSALAENSDSSRRTKLADIAISDDGLGSNVISLVGADAARFEVDGTELFLKAHTALDYESKASYAIKVSVNDPSLNGSKPVTADYRLAISDIAELPTVKSINAIKAKKKLKAFTLNKPTVIAGQNLDSLDLRRPILIGGLTLDTAIIGTNKKDKITGTSKNEILAGFKGKDVLKGGGGADGFLFDKPIGFGRKQADKIQDFDAWEWDKILVDRKAFGLGRKFKFRAVNRKSQLKKASRTKVDFIYENKTGFLYFNENGKKSGFGDGGLFAQLQGKPELFADDFRIV